MVAVEGDEPDNGRCGEVWGYENAQREHDVNNPETRPSTVVV